MVLRLRSVFECPGKKQDIDYDILPEALDYLNQATALLKAIAKEQTTAMRHVTVNSIGSWGRDPVRPDLAMCSARLEIVAHQREMEAEQQYRRIVTEEVS